MSKKKILIFIDWFLPAYKAGGPIQSVKNIIENLYQEFEFYVITSNKDLGDVEAMPKLISNVWQDRTNYKVLYLGQEYSTNRIEELIEEVRPYKCYFNSIFSINYSFTPLKIALSKNIPCVLATRGMLGAGALKIKPLKKKMFLLYFKSIGLHKKILFHATAEEEKEEIIAIFGPDTKIIVATNLSAPMPVFNPRNKIEGELNVFFLSRINPKKNLLYALELLKNGDFEGQINFTIIGAIDDNAYWKKCSILIASLPTNITVNYIGAVSHAEINGLLQNQHLLFLPTLNENYGHVIVESWQAGCLVLISDQTPWKSLYAKKIGWDIGLENQKDTFSALQIMLKMDYNEFYEFSNYAYNYASSISTDNHTIETYSKIFTAKI